MTTFIATYDLRNTNPGPHSEFLAQAEKNGWQLWILGSNSEWYRLPNTTLIGDFADKTIAVAALKKTRADTEQQLGVTVTMEKWIVTVRGASSFHSDVHQPTE